MDRIVAAGLLCALLGAGAPSVRAQNLAEESIPQLAKLRKEIKALIGIARCSNLVNCRIAGLGSRPCGGAPEYFAFSWINTDRPAIETKVAEYNIVYDDYLLKQSVSGICDVVPEPGAACVNGRCVVSGAH